MLQTLNLRYMSSKFISQYVTGFAIRDHIPHFPEFFNIWRFSNCHISTTIRGSEIILGTEQVLTLN